MNENMDRIMNAEQQINNLYNYYMNTLNRERADLMTSLNNIKNENKKITDFKNEITAIIENMNTFRNTSLR
jgi:uncharacterized membrane protein